MQLLIAEIISIHLRKSTNILLIAIILTSCQNVKKLNGTWISAYQYQEKDTVNYDLSGIAFNEIWEFNNGKLIIREFKYDVYENTRSFEFKLKGNKLIIDDEESYFFEEIVPITKDSFQLSGINNGNFKLIYKKLNDSLKSKSNEFKLSGNKYIRNFKKWTDTIHFVNDSVYKSSGWKQGNSDLMWERINHNGFDILFTDIYIPFILKKKIGNKIYVTTLGKQKEDYILEQIE
ncbi:hypothetical protein [Aureisphaera sp.]